MLGKQAGLLSTHTSPVGGGWGSRLPAAEALQELLRKDLPSHPQQSSGYILSSDLPKSRDTKFKVNKLYWFAQSVLGFSTESVTSWKHPYPQPGPSKPCQLAR